MSPVEHHISGRQYWRSLEELADSAEVARSLENEFVGYDPEVIRSMSRRRFVKIMGASMALAGLTLGGCRRWPKEKLAPQTAADGERVPGVPEFYATVMELGGVGYGLLATSYDGRPIKIEGNPAHPFSRSIDPKLGSADAYAQASVLELYDPQRSRSVVERRGGKAVQSTWEQFDAFAAAHFAGMKDGGGAGLAVLSEATRSPSAQAMLKKLAEVFPQSKRYEYEPLAGNEAAGAKLAFDRPVRPVLHLDKADVVALFDADILGTHPAHVRYAADWAVRRKSADAGEMSRVYIAESALSITGAAADVRLAVRASRVEVLLWALAGKVIAGMNVPERKLDEREAAFVEAIGRDIQARKGRAVVAAGPDLSPESHALAYRINSEIGAMGKTLTLAADAAGDTGTIVALAEEMKAGRVNTLLILGGNPAYDAPADLSFAELLAGVKTSIHLSLYHNETSAKCTWHLPRAHYLEAWGDARGWDGTVSIAQPLILPLYGGRSVMELLAGLCGEKETAGEKIVRRTILPMVKNSEDGWRKALHDGVVEGTASQLGALGAKSGVMPPIAEGHLLEVRFLQSPNVYDGRFANSGWLQEMPEPLTKLTWDNAALMSKADADRLGVVTGDVVRISVNGRSLEIAAYVLPGQPVGVIGLPLGYGRTAAGYVGNGAGFDTYKLRTTSGMHVAVGATVAKTGRKYELALTQAHHLIDATGMKGREQRVGEERASGTVIHETTLQKYKADPDVLRRDEQGRVSLQLFNPPSKFNRPHAWGMAIDMTCCIGCGGCVVACQAENNVPIVGKDQVIVGREMHWLRIDRYFKGPVDEPEVVHQPMMCVHCETAPCEQVCPVGATMHDTEGLNTMVYNRCIGTRYCSNNCPYKVRRFNYLDWHSRMEDNLRGAPRPWNGMPDTQQLASVNEIRRMVFNPEVTVRMRGVMEKCTYCVQRIHGAQIRKRNQGEEVGDGDVVTACQQACPTQAIVFGDLNDPNSKVSRLRRNNRAYGVLDETLNTRPRTKHLAKVSNPVELT